MIAALADYDSAPDVGRRFAALMSLAHTLGSDVTLWDRITELGLGRGWLPKDVHEAARLPVPGWSLRKRKPDYVRLHGTRLGTADTLAVDVAALMPAQLISARWLIEAGRHHELDRTRAREWLQGIMGSRDPDLGETIEVLRIATLMTQSELGAAADLNRWQVENIANGWDAAPAQRRAVARVFHIPEACLVDAPARLGPPTL